MKRTRSWMGLFFVVPILLILSLLLSCNATETPKVPDSGDYSVTLIDTALDGATVLAEREGAGGQALIFIGHNSYGFGDGGLKYYDTQEKSLKDTGVDVDTADFVFYGTDTIYIMGPYNSYKVSTSGDPSSWSPVELQDGGLNSFGGSDMHLHNDKIYIVNPGGWAAPYDNKIYIIDTTDDAVTTVDLGDGVNSEGFGFINVHNSALYYTDTDNGDIYCSTNLNDLSGSISNVTTTNESASGKIYFHNGMAYICVGAGFATVNMGVFMFDSANPGSTATYFPNSGQISAQYMVFKDAQTAYVTHYSGGVYQFNPADEDSDFVIIPETDPASYTGMQDIHFDGADDVIYVAVNNYPNYSSLMIIEFD